MKKQMPPAMRAQALAAAQREYQQNILTARNRRRRIIGTTSLATAGSILLLAPGVLFPGAELSAQLAVVGLAAPGGIAALVYQLGRSRFAEADMRTTHLGSDEPVPAEVAS
ncbi:MAG: hypothetical protein ABW046_20760 [Actinoplanes sp.]